MFSMLPVTDRLRCTLSTPAVAAPASLRIAEASGSGSLAFFDDEGAAGDDVAGAAEVVEVVATDDDDGADGEGPDEQPMSRAAAALTTVRTAGSLRMPVIVEGARRRGQALPRQREV
jgi:MHS family proline/betaine transporter-like MFS transporter